MEVRFVDLKAQYQTIRADIQDALAQALDGMELVLGPNVGAFEAEFATFCGTRFAVGVGSGTDALTLALQACGIGAGDEVITVANTFFATVASIAQVGAVPVFVDVDPETYTLDPSRLDAALSARTKAIVPVHLYGQMADMDPIMAVAQRHGLIVIEDACQAHGAEYHGRRAGSIGHAAAFSFYPSKNLGAYGEAGAVTTNSAAIADQVRLLRDHGSRRKYEHELVGVNSRLDELQAAVLRVKLRHLDDWNCQRRAHARTYDQLLGSADVQLPSESPVSRHTYHLYVIQTDDRDRVRQDLANRGIATGIHYPIPVHHQAAAAGIGRVAGDLHVTEAAARRILSLPMYAELQAAQQMYVADCLSAVSRVTVGASQ